MSAETKERDESLERMENSMIHFAHFNFNVLDRNRSLKFYEEALGLKVVREKEASDGSFKLVYLGDGITDFQLELTWLKDRTEPYDLGDEEFHLAFETDDYESFHKRHKEMGCICFEMCIRDRSAGVPIKSAVAGISCGLVTGDTDDD